MKRYFRLYLYFLRFSFSKAMQFRLDFYFRIFMDIIYYIVNIVFFKILFLQSKVLAGWTVNQTMIFVSVFILIDAINMTMFANNTWMLPSLINKGDLDYYLLRPVSTFFFVILRDFAANSFVNLLIAFAIVGWAIHQYPDHISIWRYFLFAAMIAVGTVIYLFVRLLFVLPVFWTHSSRGLDGMFWGLTKFMERPRQIFTGPIRLVLLSILPFSLMASVPAEVLFTANPWPLAGLCVLSVVIFYGLVIFVWRSGLRSYASASS